MRHKKQNNAHTYFFAMLSSVGGSTDVTRDIVFVVIVSIDFDGFGDDASFPFEPFLTFYSKTGTK